MKPFELRDKTSKYFIDKNINLAKTLPNGTYSTIANKFDVSIIRVRDAIYKLRQGQGIYLRKVKITPKHIPTDLHFCLLKQKIFRGSNQEGPCCDKIELFLRDEIESGGIGALLGTPAAFCASNKTNNHQIITDNLAVAHILDYETDFPIIIRIGNIMDVKKAVLKGQHWLNNSITHNADVKVIPLDAPAYYREVKELASWGLLCKVVLLTSGVWSDLPSARSKRKKRTGIDVDFNFQDPSLKLSAEYGNLHILALVRLTKNRWGVTHVHGGKQRLI